MRQCSGVCFARGGGGYFIFKVLVSGSGSSSKKN